MAGNLKPGRGRASEEWARAYAAGLLFIGLALLIFLARGQDLMAALLAVGVVGVAVLVRRVSKGSR